MGSGLCHLTMDLIDGRPLASFLDPDGAGPVAMPWGWVLRIARQLCSVLEAAHQFGIVHRDLKPANIMLCE